MNILLVDDEALARARLRRLLGRLEQAEPPGVDEAADASAARALLRSRSYDVVLLDIQMPGDSGLQLAAAIAASGPEAPAVVFVTAHEEHALQAFEHGAHDYLTKPVRAERLEQALQRVLQRRRNQAAQPGAAPRELVVVERGALLRVALDQVLYFRSQDKYTVVRTAARSHLIEQSLGELERLYASGLMRCHRSVLVATRAIASLERTPPAEWAALPASEVAEQSQWRLRLREVDECLPVSRRQLPLLRALLRGGSAAGA